MKKLITIFLICLSSSVFASTTKFQCHPVEYKNGENRDFVLTIKNGMFTKDEIIWTRAEDGYARNFPFPWISSTPDETNEYLLNRDFIKTKDNGSIIIIFSKDELFIEKKLLQGAEEGVVYNYQASGNLMETTNTSRTTFLCDKE